jgi:TPR repeat protein
LARNFKPQQVPASGGDSSASDVAQTRLESSDAGVAVTKDVRADFQLPARQSETDRKRLADVRAKAEQGDTQSQYELGTAFNKGSFGVEKSEGEAIKWYREAAAGGEVRALSSLAWLLSTSQNSDIRDGSNAVVFAEKAVAATSRKTPAYLDMLAAAYAETSQFEKAASTEQEAIALSQTEVEKNDYKSRLRLYDVHVPYRAKE